MAVRAEKQFDPRMHSTEHIANQTMVRMFDCARCFSAHLEKKKSKLDYHFLRPLTDSEVQELQNRINDVIGENLPVTEEFIPREQAQREFNLERLPEDAGETIRIIRVGEYDACACSGPHVQSTGEIGHFRIISTSFDEGILRIRFKLDKP